jgi:NADH-quinone oxidoreductase subunit N
LFAASGALTVTQATHTLPLMIGLAVLHVATTVLVGPQRGWRYPVVQSAALACVLFGTTLWYGASGTLSLDPASEVQTAASNSLAALGIGITIAGLSQWWGLEPWGAFRWAPHTGQAPTPRGLLIALILPGAAAAAMSRLSGALAGPWLTVLAVLGSLSLVVGYLRALCSYHIAGMLRGIIAAQSGILALALVCQPTVGWAPFFYLLASNALSLLGLWVVISDGDTNTRDDVAGLGKRTPWLAAGATLCLLNLAGMPPLAGLTGQTALLQASTQEGHRWLQAPLAASSLPAWLWATRWILTFWVRLPQDRPQRRTSPEIALIALLSAGGTLLAGLGAARIWGWIDALIGGL